MTMKYILEIPDKEMVFAEEFFKKISFIKKVKALKSNEIANPKILKSIEDYEGKKSNPTALSLRELKTMLNA